MSINTQIVIWNANGLCKSKPEVEHYIKTNQVDVMLVSETHLTTRSYFNIPGYEIINAFHPGNRMRAGASVIVKRGIEFEELESVQLDWFQCAKIRLMTQTGEITIAAAYLPPRHTINRNDLTLQLMNLGPKFILGGDFNAKHTWWGSRVVNPKGTILYKCILDLGCIVHSTGEPTYWPSDPVKIPDLLDFAISKGINPVKISTVGCYDLCSDHSMVKVLLNTSYIRTIAKTKLIRRNTNLEHFKNWLEQHVDPEPQIYTEDDIDTAVESLTRNVHLAAHLSTPLTSPSINHRSQRDSHLWSTELSVLISTKRRLRRVWQLSRSRCDKTNYNRACKKLKQLLLELKSKSLEAYLADLEPGNAEHNLWNATKYLKRPIRRVAPVQTATGVWCRSSQEKANAFADHLSSCFQPFDLCGPADLEETLNFLDIACPLDLPLTQITSDEIQEEIAHLKVSKSPGYDCMDAIVLKQLPPNCIRNIKAIMNECFRLGHFPSQWKCAQVVVVPKPNKPESEIASYRPISLLVILSKILERLFLKRLLPILEDNHIIPDHQFGFRQGHGAIQQVHRVVNRILDSFENKKYCGAVFLDIRQAFDRVWHQGLLFKLKSKLPMPYYLFLKSYVQNRKFYVKINNSESPIHDVNAGVPQGSVLGPILYSAYTSDMPIPTGPHITTCTYADDTAFLFAADTITVSAHGLQEILNNVEPWLARWNIVINAEKSSHLTFTLRPGSSPPVSINGSDIPQVQSAKYLGLTLDKRLTWKDHITTKVKLMSFKFRKMGWLLFKRSKLSIKNKLLLYKTIIKPAWKYGIELWGTASSTNIKRLERSENKIIRHIIYAPFYVRNSTFRRDFKIPSVVEEIKNSSSKHSSKLNDHENHLAINLLDNSNQRRRLKRFHPLDLPFRVP